MKKIINTSNAPAAIRPYSQAIAVNGMLYISGQIPVNPIDGSISNDIAEQTKQCMENIRAILAEAGTEMNNIIRCGIFIKDMNDFAIINEVYGSYFQGDYPIRATVEVSRLPKDVKIEIEAMALLK